MDPHFITIPTTKTRDMSFNDSGGMVYLHDAVDENGDIQPPTYHGELRYVGSGSTYNNFIFSLPLVVAVDKGTGDGPEWVNVILSRSSGPPDDGLPYFA